jgi:FkbM family methyltransferase
LDWLRRARDAGVVLRQVVDVGASDGGWTRECLRVFPDARYLLVEPREVHAAALSALTSSRSNVRVWRGALGSRPGSLDLHVHGDQSSFLASDSFPTDTAERVEVRTLDSFLGTDLLQPPDLIKADVQGYELEVLRGAAHSLETAKLLLLEVSYRRMYRDLPLAHDVIAHAASAGFRICDVCTYAGRPSDGLLMQSDLLFAAEGSPVFADETWR